MVLKLNLFQEVWYSSNNVGKRGKMRVLHLGFQLDCPLGDEKAFAERNKQVFQPFFAFLERNVQKYPDFRVSLLILGAWLDQAEKFDKTLLERLKVLAEAKKVDFLATPYYNSLSFFYDRAEFEAELWLHKEKLRELFGVECYVMALADLMYNDEIAKAAENLGYFGVLAGGWPENLARRYESRVYDAAGGCRHLRVIGRNMALSEYIMHDFAERQRALADGDVLADFRRQLDLAAMRGGAINLFVDAETFARQRQAGVIKFFDDLLAQWLGEQREPLVTATELATLRNVREEISIRKTVSWRDRLANQTVRGVARPGLVRMSDIEFHPSLWLDSAPQRKVLTQFYQLKPEVFRTEDDDLIAEFCQLLSFAKVYELSDDVRLKMQVLSDSAIASGLGDAARRGSNVVAEEILQKLTEMQKRIAEFWRKKQAEIERHEVKVKKMKSQKAVKRPEDTASETVEVKVKIGQQAQPIAEADGDVVETSTEDAEDFIDETCEGYDADRDDASDFESAERPIRRVLRKIVIE